MQFQPKQNVTENMSDNWMQKTAEKSQTASGRKSVREAAARAEIATGDMEAAGQQEITMQNRFIENNIRLVYWVLHRFSGRGYDMEELFQVGTVGLVKAVRRFDSSREVAFSTYAVPMIIGEIRRFLRDDGMIHINRKIKEDAAKIANVREQMKKTENREPTLDELSDLLGLKREEILLALGSSASVVSIHEPAPGGGYRTSGGEWTIEEQLVDLHNEPEAVINRVAVCQLMAELDEQSRMLLILRFGKRMTQSQVAKQMGMTQVAVSRMEKGILLRLRGQL